jgi:hypothetical protein
MSEKEYTTIALLDSEKRALDKVAPRLVDDPAEATYSEIVDSLIESYRQ